MHAISLLGKSNSRLNRWRIIPIRQGTRKNKGLHITLSGEVCSDTQPLIHIALDGFNVCIFADGQTGSAKTHTMSGPNNITEEKVGVNYRMCFEESFLWSDELGTKESSS
ncbi:hypothetical protein P8452_56295 [Trifolium repens]|nr:hypothetical protein P8452_56295 [Trifolium repens]